MALLTLCYVASPIITYIARSRLHNEYVPTSYHSHLRILREKLMHTLPYLRSSVLPPRSCPIFIDKGTITTHKLPIVVAKTLYLPPRCHSRCKPSQRPHNKLTHRSKTAPLLIATVRVHTTYRVVALTISFGTKMHGRRSSWTEFAPASLSPPSSMLPQSNTPTLPSDGALVPKAPMLSSSRGNSVKSLACYLRGAWRKGGTVKVWGEHSSE